MVGVGPLGSESILARVSIVNFYGYPLYDSFVKPLEKVTDYRTWVSGVRSFNLKNAPSFSSVQSQVASLIKGRILIGHAIHNDLKALLLDHPNWLIRDTSKFKPFRDLAKTKFPSLKNLARLTVGVEVQGEGEEHSSVEDARVTMEVYKTGMKVWEAEVRRNGKGRGNAVGLRKEGKRKVEKESGDSKKRESNAEGAEVKKRAKKVDQGEWWKDL